MVNTYTGKGPAQVAIKWSASQYKRKRNLLSYDPWPDQSVDVTANKHVTKTKSTILKNDLLSMDYITRGTALFVNANYIFLQQHLKILSLVMLGALKTFGPPTT